MMTLTQKEHEFQMNKEQALTGHFWFRESTQEWVFEVELNMFDTNATYRFPGKTKVDAIKEFRENFNELYYDLILISNEND